MTEAAAAGITPGAFWHCTYREVFAAISGDVLRRRRDRQLALWQAWQAAAFQRARKLNPQDLTNMLSKLEPRRIMTPREQRTALLGIAKAMGAEVVYRKKAA